MDAEPIVFALIDPIQIKEGTFKALKKDDLKKGTLSVCRGLHATSDQAQNSIVAPQLASDDSRTDEGYLWAFARDIREIQYANGIGGICVVDDGLEHFTAHAVLGYADLPIDVDANTKGSYRLAVRGELLKVLAARGIQKWSEWNFATAK